LALEIVRKNFGEAVVAKDQRRNGVQQVILQTNVSLSKILG